MKPRIKMRNGNWYAHWPHMRGWGVRNWQEERLLQRAVSWCWSMNDAKAKN